MIIMESPLQIFCGGLEFIEGYEKNLATLRVSAIGANQTPFLVNQ